MRERLPYLEKQSPALHGPQLFGGEPVGKPLLHRLDGAQSRRLLRAGCRSWPWQHLLSP